MSVATLANDPKTRARYRESQDPEVDLMLRVQGDDAAAFAELIDRYWPMVFGRFYRRLADRQEAEDLAQDVFLRLYRHRKRYQPRAKFATWIFYIAQNVLRNALRSRKRHPAVCLESREGTSRECLLPDRCEAPSGRMERAEIAKVVRSAVSDLGKRQRTALELHQFHDWTYAEVAAKMHMSPKAAKSLLYRARTQLRANLTAFMANA